MTAREHVLLAIRSLLDEDFGTPRDEVELDAIGLDSLGRVVLAWELDERLGIEVPDGVENTWRTVGDCISWAEKAASGRCA